MTSQVNGTKNGCIMKNFNKIFFAAVAAAFGLASCSQELTPVEKPQGNLVTVNFGAESNITCPTKATLTTEDEKLFTSAWENGDALSVKYSNDNKTAGATTSGVVSATWTTDHFEAKMPEYHGMWDYNVVYPEPDANSKVDFGSARTQKGNAYNSKYDLMKGGAIEMDADAGKTSDGKNIVFNMTRQTAVAYFHLTSALDEEVVSAKLSVEGGNVASSLVMLLDHTDGFDLSTEDLNEITITFDEGTAPKASDFQLWFNVLPTKYTKMTLAVETANHTMTISRNTPEIDEYVAGNLYKVVKAIPAEKWVKKEGETPISKDFELVTGALSDWSGSYLLVGEYSTETTPKSSYYAFDESVYVDNTWGKCSEVVVENNAIASTYGAMALEVVPGTTENTYSILTPSGKYLSASAAKRFNLSETYSADNCDFTISFGEKNAIVIKQASSTNGRQIRYNYNNGNGGFRWYDSTTADAVYLYKGPSANKYSVSCRAVEGGKIAASLLRAEAGAEVTLTATPAEGYAFNNDWSVKGADETVIEVVDGKFTMPAQNVTVSGTFSKVAYTITKAAAENGSFTVKNGGAEVTTAFKGDKLTLEATPAEGFTFGAWTVTYMDGETEKTANVNANTFYMPAANVTVSASFVKEAVVPVYASVAELIAAGKPTTTGTKVTVTITDEEITKFYKSGTYTNGVYFMVGTQEVQICCKNTPTDWEVGGTISGTLTNCDWKLYVDKYTQKETWKLCPADYSELTYKAPLPSCATPVITVAEDGAVSISCETAGATIHYTVGENPADPTEADAVFSAVTLTDGQTIKAIAVAEGFKPSAVASKKYVVGGAAGLTTVAKKISEISGTLINGTKVSSMTMDDVITLSASTNGNNGKVYSNGAEWRLYQSDTGTMTVSSKAGYVIESIIVTFTNKKSGTLLYNSNAVTSGKAVSVSGSSVKFTLGNSSTATNGQIIVTEISVTYKQQ